MDLSVNIGTGTAHFVRGLRRYTVASLRVRLMYSLKRGSSIDFHFNPYSYTHNHTHAPTQYNGRLAFKKSFNQNLMP